MERNDDLQAILSIAADIRADRTNMTDPAAAIRYAVLKRLEDPDHLGVPVMVKYGSAPDVRDEMGATDDPVWSVPMREDWTLFRVEPEGVPTPNLKRLVHRQFRAIGAWHVGTAAPRHSPSWMHYHYLWPEDHPVTEMVPGPE